MASSGAHTELVLAGLLFSVAVLVTAARVLAVPYPIFLVLGGLAIAWIPGIPNPELEPDLVLLIFLPPLLYSASFFTGLRELRENVRQISMLAIGLVLATALAVALVAHAVIDVMARRLRPRRDRLSHRPGRRHGDRRPHRGSPPSGHDRRGRGADQRRDRA